MGRAAQQVFMKETVAYQCRPYDCKYSLKKRWFEVSNYNEVNNENTILENNGHTVELKVLDGEADALDITLFFKLFEFV